MILPNNPAIKYNNPSFPLVGNPMPYHVENKERFRTSRNDNVQVFDCRVNNTVKNIIFIFFALLFFLSPEFSFAVEKEVGNIKDLKGAADILREKEKVGVSKNKSVFMTDTVKTYENSRVKILFIDDSLIMTGENSSFLITEHFNNAERKNGTAVFNLTDGVINIIVGKKGLEIHTPTSVTAARGTSYLLWVEKNKTGMAVTEGRVEIRNALETVSDKQLIPAGRMSYVSEGKPPTSPVITPPEIVKVFYEKTLEEKERWGPVILSAKGSGVPPPSAVNPAQARLMALRAAKTDAMRNLLEQAQGVTILSDSTVEDFALKNDLIKSGVDSYIKGAWVAEERQMSDGSFEVVMEIGLGIKFRRMFLEQVDK